MTPPTERRAQPPAVEPPPQQPQPQRRRILVIDDNDAIHDDFRKTLSTRRASTDVSDDEAILFGSGPSGADAAASPAVEYEIDTALQGQEGLEKAKAAAAEGRPYLLAFVDMRMPPGWDGVQTIRNLWAADPTLQVVICSAYSDYSWEQIVQELGSTDRLLILKKPFDDVEVCQLATALTEKWIVTRQANLKLAEMETLVQERTAELRKAALEDKLTGLPNRAMLTDRLGQRIAQSKRAPHRKFAVLFLDFDRFKVVNDSLGHAIGDLLLRGIADRLRQAVRDADTVSHAGARGGGGGGGGDAETSATAARLGGDEFIILLENLREDHDAARVAERLLETLAAPYLLEGHTVHSTASIGITTSAVGYSTAEAMIRDADTAMYRAKAAGKARYVMFDQQMHRAAMERLTLENDLRKAIGAGEMAVAYQPIVSLESGGVVAVEALARWNHPARGAVPPDHFIPLAEEIGVIVPIGAWVLERACRTVADWHRRRPDLADVCLSVNLSARQLADRELLARVRRALAETGLAPDRLILEITETAIMEDTEHAITVLRQIRALGVALHVDDFGTGYSSLSCLHTFPINGLKIDRSFVNTVGERRDYAAVVNAIVALAHNLEIDLVAEGVETADQVVLLKSLGCDRAQGFYFARPMEPDAAEAYATRQKQAA